MLVDIVVPQNVDIYIYNKYMTKQDIVPMHMHNYLSIKNKNYKKKLKY